jgi:hypothetical protein
MALKDGRSVEISAEGTTRIMRLLDLESKMKALDILKQQISSISCDTIERYVFSNLEKSRFHLWGLCAKSICNVEIICAAIFRRHSRLGLIELNLIACQSVYCREGFGTTFLKQMIHKWKLEGFSHVLTFADFGAVKFFENIGFSHNLGMPRGLFDSWIDKYSYATLMGLALHESSVQGERYHKEDPIPVDVLVFFENVDRKPKEIWTAGFALLQSDTSVLVQYSYQLVCFVETLPLESPRLRLPVSA